MPAEEIRYHASMHTASAQANTVPALPDEDSAGNERTPMKHARMTQQQPMHPTNHVHVYTLSCKPQPDALINPGHVVSHGLIVVAEQPHTHQDPKHKTTMSKHSLKAAKC
jgi:hypothetical protein